MYSTKFQVTQAHLLQAQQERRQILIELEQVKQLQVQLQSQLEQVVSLVKVLEGLPLFDSAMVQSQWEIQAQLLQNQEEPFQNLDLESASSQARLPQAKTISPSFSSELASSELGEKVQPPMMELEVVPSSNSNLAIFTSKPDELLALKKIDYTLLRDLLAASQWQEADAETKLIMLKVSNKKLQGKFEQADFQNFACEALDNIDQLWINYSEGHFGFSVQKRIFEKVGGKPGFNDYKAYCRFGEEVGWLVKNQWLGERDLKFSLNAAPGHLPIAPFASLIRDIRARKIYFCDFLSRLGTCNLS